MFFFIYFSSLIYLERGPAFCYNNMHHYELCVVGAGVAGLYAAYEWRKRNPAQSVIVLEAGERAGGRLAMARFGGTDVLLGAGIGRSEKDARLTRLLRELHVHAHVFERHVAYGPGVAPVNEAHIQELKDAVGAMGPAMGTGDALTFGDFARQTLGRPAADALIKSMGYTDMVRESAREVMLSYGLDDNYVNIGAAPPHGMAVNWQDVVKALVKAIGPRRFLYHTPVVSISNPNNTEQGYKIVRTPFGPLAAKQVIVATTLPTLRKLFPRVREYRSIQSQPFLRVYAKFPMSVRPIIASACQVYTVVKPPLQKIIPMNAEKGVYMIAYSDNTYADRLEAFSESTPANCKHFARLVERALGLPKMSLSISSIRAKYWDVGTHFVKPGGGADSGNGGAASGQGGADAFFERCRHPTPGVLVVGEVVSQHHRGWVEGALESVDAVMA